MKKYIHLFIFIAGLIIPNSAFGQYDVTNGLMHENVLGVWQDKEVYIYE